MEAKAATGPHSSYPPDPQGDARSYIHSSGEMADRICAYPWDRTSVGPIDQWPEILLNTVNTLLGSRQPMFLWWGEELIQFYNDAYRPSLGADKHPLALGQRAQECWPEIWSIICPLIVDVMRNGSSIWREDQLIPIFRNGKLEDVYWTFSYSPVWDHKGRVCGTLVVCADTTSRVRGEAAVRSERARLLEVFEQAPAFFALLEGPDHVITMVNPLYMQLVNHRDILGKPVRVALPEAVAQGYTEILDRTYQGHPFVGRGVRYVSSGGGSADDERYLDFVYQPLRNSAGAVCGIIVLGVDVTESRKAHEALMQNEKLAAVGRLASSIAHEINNPLESVTNLLYLARSTSDVGEIHEYLDIAEQEARRIALISRQTLHFHKQATSPTEVQCDELLQGSMRMYHTRLINSRITVLRRDRCTRPVLCFEGEIRQVLNNLIGNAIDAMGAEGGKLYLRSRSGRDWHTGEPGAIITIADTGEGIAPAERGKVFHAFYTTKGLAGTGLGLWVSDEIVRRHRGHLRFRSSQRPGHSGTVFTVFLPFDAVYR